MKLYRLTIILLFASILLGCEHDDTDPTPATSEQVVFVYFGMDDNILDRYGRSNIESIKRGLQASGVRNGKVVAFCDFLNSNTKLVEYYVDNRNNCQERTLIDYGENLDSSDPAILARSISDMRRLTSADEYIMFVGSHGLGWASRSLTSRSRSTKAVMQTSHPSRDVVADKLHFMNTEEFANTIPEGVFSAIVFDACYMANIESVYPFRNKVKYYVGAPSEIAAEGIPYEKSMSFLFDRSKSTIERLSTLCEEYYLFYESYQSGSPGGNIALIDCSKLDQLATTSKAIINRIAPNYWEAISGIQYYDRLYNTKLFYDMEHAMRTALGTEDQLYIDFRKALNDAVICKYSTPMVFDIKMANFSGISMFVPRSTSPIHNAEYKNTSWYSAVYTSLSF